MSKKEPLQEKCSPHGDQGKVPSEVPADVQSDESDAASAPGEGLGGSTSDPRATLEERVALLEEEKKAACDRYLRSAAELENFKKRTEREVSDFRRYANEAILRDLLPAVDNLERAIEAAGDRKSAEDSILAGVDMTLKEIRKVFERHAVRPIDASGQIFDPTLHQAVMQEASDAHPDNTVIREFQKGYLIHDRLLRPAMVVVSKAADKRTADAEPVG